MARFYRGATNSCKATAAARLAIVVWLAGAGQALAVPSAPQSMTPAGAGASARAGATSGDFFASWAAARRTALASARAHLLAGDAGAVRKELTPLLWANTRDAAANVLYVASLEETYQEIHDLPADDPDAVDTLTAMLRDVFMPDTLAVRVVLEIQHRSRAAERASSQDDATDAAEYRTVSPNAWWTEPVPATRAAR